MAAQSSSNCFACATGTYCQSGVQYSCQAGTYASSTGTITCTACPAGYYCPSGSISPTPCPNGLTSSIRSQSQSSCSSCPIGSYCQNGIQTACQGGTYQNSAGK